MGYEFKTDRLWLRPSRVEDLEPLHALWTNDHVRHFLFDDRVISLDEACGFVETSVANFEQHGYGLWLVFALEADHLVGFAGFLRSEAETPNLIFGVHPDSWKKGYATEAAGAVLKYVFSELSQAKVKADVDEPNVLSVRVLQKLGMSCTGRRVVAGRSLLDFELSRRS